VSKKLFSLVFADKETINLDKHIIPADSISHLMDALELVSKVKKDAEQYKEAVALECEKLKAAAQVEGFNEGYQQWADHIAKLEEEIIKVREETEKVVISVALKAAKKIVGREIDLSDNTIVDIVSTTLKAVSQHKKIAIYVNKKDLDPLEKGRPRLRENFENLEALTVRERPDVVRGGCIIETEGGIINAQLENQWNALEKAFTNMMKQKTKETKKT
jgi:type III secretion protein L